jgi:hypothetical protein
LPVTFPNFEEFGISYKSIGPGIREAVALGFVEITERGRPSESDFGRHPNYFRLTFLGVRRGTRRHDPTDEWKQIKTPDEALKIARKAREAKDERAVAKAKGKAKKSASQKSVAGGENFLVTGGKIHPETPDAPGGKIHPTVPGGKIHPTIYISGEGEAA